MPNTLSNPYSMPKRAIAGFGFIGLAMAGQILVLMDIKSLGFFIYGGLIGAGITWAVFQLPKMYKSLRRPARRKERPAEAPRPSRSDFAFNPDGFGGQTFNQDAQKNDRVLKQTDRSKDISIEPAQKRRRRLKVI